MNTFRAALYPDQLQTRYVARSVVSNFPDLTMVQVKEQAPGTRGLIVHSGSAYGESDFGVSRERVEAWLGPPDKTLLPSSER